MQVNIFRLKDKGIYIGDLDTGSPYYLYCSFFNEDGLNCKQSCWGQCQALSLSAIYSSNMDEMYQPALYGMKQALPANYKSLSDDEIVFVVLEAISNVLYKNED